MQWQYLAFWPLFCAGMAYMQGCLMPAIRRTPPGPEADRQDRALHRWGAVLYALPLLLLPPTTWLVQGALALVVRVAEFDPVLNAAAGSPLFYVGRTAAVDRWLWKISPVHAERLSLVLRVTALVLGLAGVVYLKLHEAGH